MEDQRVAQRRGARTGCHLNNCAQLSAKIPKSLLRERASDKRCARISGRFSSTANFAASRARLFAGNWASALFSRSCLMAFARAGERGGEGRASKRVGESSALDRRATG